MLETFRKYTGLMFVVLILLFIGLVFFGSSSSQSPLAGPKVAFAYDKGYTKQEYDRFVTNPALMLKTLAQSSVERAGAIEPYLGRLGVWADPRQDLTNDQLGAFLVNRVALQKAMDEFGVAASEKEVHEMIERRLFWKNGGFDKESYDTFVEDQLPKFSMNNKHFQEILAEILSMEKLVDILGAGIIPSRELVRQGYLFNNQQVTYHEVSTSLAEARDSLAPVSDADVKAHWEANKAKFKSEPKRKLTYVISRPDYAKLQAEKQAKLGPAIPPTPNPAIPGDPSNPNPPNPLLDPLLGPGPGPGLTTEEEEEGGCGQDPVEEETVPEPEPEEGTPEPEEETTPVPTPEGEGGEVPAPGEQPVDEDESPVGEAPAPGEKPVGEDAPPVGELPELPTPGEAEPPKPPLPSLTPAERTDAINMAGGLLDDMREELREQDDHGFEKLAEEFGFEVRTTELVTEEALPLEFRAAIRGKRDYTAADAVFDFELIGDTPADRTAEILKVGSDQWLLFRVDEEEEPAELSYEDAKEKAREDLTKEKALKAMRETVEKDHAALKKALDEGKSFEKAALELEIKYSTAKDKNFRFNFDPILNRRLRLAWRTNTGGLSEISDYVVPTGEVRAEDKDERAIFIHLASREVQQERVEDSAALESLLVRVEDFQKQMGLDNWLAEIASSADFKFAEEK